MKTRVGTPKYTEEEIERLLEAVEEVKQLGSNQWDVVAEKFNKSGEEIEHKRDKESLKKKFDTLESTKKSTGDPL